MTVCVSVGLENLRPRIYEGAQQLGDLVPGNGFLDEGDFPDLGNRRP